MAKYDKDFWTKLAQGAGVPEEQAQAFLQVATGNEKVAKALEDGFLRHDDYSRTMDDLRKKEEAFLKQQGEWTDWYNGAVQKVAAKDAALARYRAEYGDLDAGSDGNRSVVASPVDVAQYVTRKELEEMAQQRDLNTITLIKKAVRYGTDFLHRFGEPMDVDALADFAIKNQLTIDQAYKDFIAPRLFEKGKADVERRVTEAKAEGAREALSQHHLPVDTGPKTPHPFFDSYPKAKGAKLSDTQLREGFVEAWREAGAAK